MRKNDEWVEKDQLNMKIIKELKNDLSNSQHEDELIRKKNQVEALQFEVRSLKAKVKARDETLRRKTKQKRRFHCEVGQDQGG